MSQSETEMSVDESADSMFPQGITRLIPIDVDAESYRSTGLGTPVAGMSRSPEPPPRFGCSYGKDKVLAVNRDGFLSASRMASLRIASGENSDRWG